MTKIAPVWNWISDLQHPKNHRLILDRQIQVEDDTNVPVFTLTKEGRRFLRHQNLVPKEQALYDGFVKPKELAHDAWAL
jgi:hypothetical protein